MMKNTIFALLLICPAVVYPAPITEKRVVKLEKKVVRLDKRVTALESDKPASASSTVPVLGNVTAQPVSVSLVSKKQVVTETLIAIKLVLEFRNVTSYSINGFSGTLVFKAEGENGVYIRKMSYAHALTSGETARIEMLIKSDEAKQYLKFVKAATINTALINQRLYD